MMLPFTRADWLALVPIAVVAVTGLVVLIVDLFARAQMPRYAPILIGVGGGIVAGSNLTQLSAAVTD